MVKVLIKKLNQNVELTKYKDRWCIWHGFNGIYKTTN